MKTKTAMLTGLVLLMSSSFSVSAIAGESEITWTEPENYRDIRPAADSKKKFQNRVFSGLEKHMSKLAESLPEGYKLSMNVTDVDLAGDVTFSVGQDVRVVKELYHPRMDFSYTLTDADGKVVKEEKEVKLRDMNFMRNTSLRYRNDFLGYEKKMLDDWFKDNFSELTK